MHAAAANSPKDESLRFRGALSSACPYRAFLRRKRPPPLRLAELYNLHHTFSLSAQNGSLARNEAGPQSRHGIPAEKRNVQTARSAISSTPQAFMVSPALHPIMKGERLSFQAYSCLTGMQISVTNFSASLVMP